MTRVYAAAAGICHCKRQNTGHEDRLANDRTHEQRCGGRRLRPGAAQRRRAKSSSYVPSRFLPVAAFCPSRSSPSETASQPKLAAPGGWPAAAVSAKLLRADGALLSLSKPVEQRDTAGDAASPPAAAAGQSPGSDDCPSSLAVGENDGDG